MFNVFGGKEQTATVGATLKVTDASFQSEVIMSTKPVLVDFWAPWCGPCKMLGPVIEALAVEYGDTLKVVKVNVDENSGVAARYDIASIPTMLVFKGGEAVGRLVGFMPKPTLKAKLDGILQA